MDLQTLFLMSFLGLVSWAYKEAISRWFQDNWLYMLASLRFYRNGNSEFSSKIHPAGSMTFKYLKNGKMYHLTVPYDRGIQAVTSFKKVYLISPTPGNSEGQKTEITQEPGIPYLVTARQMGGIKLRIEDLEDLDPEEDPIEFQENEMIIF